jgi:hypothetical protein
MMRLIAGTLAVLVTGSACLAEPAPSAPPPPGADAPRPEGPRRGPPDGERDGGWHRPPFMAGMKGGHLRFRRGETGIDFKCAADDSTKACVDALMPLVDKLLQAR